MSLLPPIDLNPDAKTLRSFGFVALGGFGLLALAAYRESLIFAFGLGEARVPVALGLATLGVVSALLSLVAPRANRWLYAGMTLVALPIGWVVSHVLLGALFFGIFTPIALLFRALRRDELRLRYDPTAASYWSEARSPRPHEAYFRQF